MKHINKYLHILITGPILFSFSIVLITLFTILVSPILLYRAIHSSLPSLTDQTLGQEATSATNISQT